MANKIIFFFTIVLTSFIFGFKPKGKQKLFMYITTTNNLVELSFNDTANIPDICIKLHLDTINTEWLTKCKKKNSMEKMFVFQNHVFYEHQLFDLNEYNKLKKYYLGGLSISSGVIDSHGCNSTCTNDDRSRFIINNTKNRVKNRKVKEPFIITSLAVTGNQDDAQIELNNIYVWIIPSP